MDKNNQGLFRKTLLSLFIASSISALCACGGGGGSGPAPTPTPTPTPTPEPETTSVNLQIIDGYLKDAEVFADLNRNFIHDNDEPSGTTDANGLVTLNIPKK